MPSKSVGRCRATAVGWAAFGGSWQDLAVEESTSDCKAGCQGAVDWLVRASGYLSGPAIDFDKARFRWNVRDISFQADGFAAPSTPALAHVDKQRRRELKALGKAEVARRSAAVRAALREANPAELGDPEWSGNYRRGVERERWLRESLPFLDPGLLHKLFVVREDVGAGWVPHIGGYLLCTSCGYAMPSALPRRMLFWRACGCGNVRWRMLLWWRRCKVKHPERLAPIKLTGRG